MTKKQISITVDEELIEEALAKAQKKLPGVEIYLSNIIEAALRDWVKN